MEQLIKEMKVSEYDRGEIREVVVCGLTGWKRKLVRRKDTEMYRSAKSTLVGRCKRKLLAKTSWYKKREKEKKRMRKMRERAAAREESQHQRISILSNEVVRRMSNINDAKISIEEKYVTVEQLIKEMKVSGYDRSEIREVVVCGLTGWKRKLVRRKDTEMYRSV